MQQPNFLSLILALVSGFITGIFIEPLKHRLLAAKVSLLFKNDALYQRGQYIFKTPETEMIGNRKLRYSNCYVRAKVKNNSWFTAKNCLAFLTKIEYVNHRISSVLIEEYLPLQWSYIGYKNLNIPTNTEVFIALLSIDPFHRRLIPQTEYKPLLYEEHLNKPGQYNFTFKVVGENLKPVTLKIYIRISQDKKGRLKLDEAGTLAKNPLFSFH